MQISYTFWRVCTKTFLWLVIIYSMLILVCIYTYQFDAVRHAWRDVTGFSKQESVAVCCLLVVLHRSLKEHDISQRDTAPIQWYMNNNKILPDYYMQHFMSYLLSVTNNDIRSCAFTVCGFFSKNIIISLLCIAVRDTVNTKCALEYVMKVCKSSQMGLCWLKFTKNHIFHKTMHMSWMTRDFTES